MKKDVYDDVDGLLKDIQSDIKDILLDEVLDEAKKIEMEHIDSDVYTYNPQIYIRRPTGGISDPDNIIGTICGDMELEVDNITRFNDGYGTSNHGFGLPQLINDGDDMLGFFYDYPGEFNQPRPFLDNTEKEIDHTSRVDNALEKGLRKRGYDVKNA